MNLVLDGSLFSWRSYIKDKIRESINKGIYRMSRNLYNVKECVEFQGVCRMSRNLQSVKESPDHEKFGGINGGIIGRKSNRKNHVHHILKKVFCTNDPNSACFSHRLLLSLVPIDSPDSPGHFKLSMSSNEQDGWS